jgi:hypothetical protein
MEDKQLGQMYVTALRAKYVAEMEEAKATLILYTTRLVAIGEHSDLMEEHDKWIEKYANAKDKLESLNELFGNQSING